MAGHSQPWSVMQRESSSWELPWEPAVPSLWAETLGVPHETPLEVAPQRQPAFAEETLAEAPHRHRRPQARSNREREMGLAKAKLSPRDLQLWHSSAMSCRCAMTELCFANTPARVSWRQAQQPALERTKRKPCSYLFENTQTQVNKNLHPCHFEELAHWQLQPPSSIEALQPTPARALLASHPR